MSTTMGIFNYANANTATSNRLPQCILTLITPTKYIILLNRKPISMNIANPTNNSTSPTTIHSAMAPPINNKQVQTNKHIIIRNKIMCLLPHPPISETISVGIYCKITQLKANKTKSRVKIRVPIKTIIK